MIIGICGKSGSGKSTYANKIIRIFDNRPVYVDIDKIGHDSLKEDDVKSSIVKQFGEELIDNNEINRKKLSDIVFNSKEEMEKLTQITWKYMENIIDRIIEENKGRIILLDWQLLPKTKFFDMCDLKILLDIPYEVRKQRILKRDNISEEKFDLREKASYNYDNDKFDIVIESN